MTPRPSIRSPRSFERGGVSFVTILIVAAVAGAVYMVIHWLPVWVLHYEVKQVTRDYMNQAIKNRDDAELVLRMTQKLASLDTEVVTDSNGVEQKVPTVQVAPNEVTWERDLSSSPPMLHVSYEYKREIHYLWLNKVSEWVGTVDLDNDLSIPNWGPAR